MIDRGIESEIKRKLPRTRKIPGQYRFHVQFYQKFKE
jgi:hypothetical protein